MKNRISICTVSFHHEDHIKLNSLCASELNPDSEIQWIIVNNSPSEFKIKNHSCLKKLNIYSGKPIQQFNNPNEQHADSLMEAVTKVKTRFVLVSDPDFYVLFPGWINEVISYMKENKYTFFGAPWHPKWYKKYRYYPCIHCLFIDLKRVGHSHFDFRPELSKNESRIINIKKSSKNKKFLANNIVIDMLRMLKYLLIERIRIGKEGDTGKVFYNEYFGKTEHRAKCLVPVYNPEKESQFNINISFNKCIENFLPDRLSYIPKKQGYFVSNSRYSDFITEKGWEQFLWKGEIFGLHYRGYPKRNSIKNYDYFSELKEFVMKTLLDIDEKYL